MVPDDAHEERHYVTSLRVSSSKLLVVGIGGTTGAGSSTERALRVALQACRRAWRGDYLLRWRFSGGVAALRTAAAVDGGAARIDRPDAAQGRRGDPRLAQPSRRRFRLVEECARYSWRNCMTTVARAYLEGRAVGCIATVHGGQAGDMVLTGLRSAVHALRGWPTPYGAVVNTLETPLNGEAIPVEVEEALAQVGRQVVELAGAFHAAKAAAASDAVAGAMAMRPYGQACVNGWESGIEADRAGECRSAGPRAAPRSGRGQILSGTVGDLAGVAGHRPGCRRR